jgi:hypothetical protein
VKYSGGGGCYSTANDYIKLLMSLLRTITVGEPTRQKDDLLSASSLHTMFNQTLSPSASAALHKTIYAPLSIGLAGNIPPSTELSYGLGGLVNVSAVSSATARLERTNALETEESKSHLAQDPIRSQTNFVA